MSEQQDYITFESDVTEQELRDLLKTQADVQEVLSRFDGRKAHSMKEYFNHYGIQKKSKENMVDYIEERTQLEERIRNNTETLSKTSHPGNREQLEVDIANDKASLTKVKERIKRRDASDVMIGKTEFKTNRMYANGLDRLAEHIGKWFETGAVGPGTVTYGNRTFTAE